ncbi:unnamed protein product [Cochlearia groenlandica]
MLPKHLRDGKPQNSFYKSLPLGGNWKSKSMRNIPDEIVRSTSTEHRVVFSVRWGNSWMFWLEQDKKGSTFMIEEDWNEFVNDNFFGPEHTVIFTHEDTMFFQVKIFDKDEKEIMTYEALVAEPETKPEKQNPHKENVTTAFASSSANGGTNPNDANLEDPERYLLNPGNPFFVKTITKRNHVLYISRFAVKKYALKFGPPGSIINYILPDAKKAAKLKIYGEHPCLSGWAELCRRNNIKLGDSLVCELELSGGLVTDVRLHLMK